MFAGDRPFLGLRTPPRDGKLESPSLGQARDQAAVEHGFEDFRQLQGSGYRPGYDPTLGSEAPYNRAVVVIKWALRGEGAA